MTKRARQLQKRVERLERENRALKAKAKFSKTKVINTTLPESFVNTAVAPKSQLAEFPAKPPAKTPKVKEPTALRPGTFAKPVATYAQVVAGQAPAFSVSIATTTECSTTSVAASKGSTPSADKAASTIVAAKTELSSQKRLAVNDLRHRLQRNEGSGREGGSGKRQPLQAVGGPAEPPPHVSSIKAGKATVSDPPGSTNQASSMKARLTTKACQVGGPFLHDRHPAKMRGHKETTPHGKMGGSDGQKPPPHARSNRQGGPMERQGPPPHDNTQQGGPIKQQGSPPNASTAGKRKVSSVSGPPRKEPRNHVCPLASCGRHLSDTDRLRSHFYERHLPKDFYRAAPADQLDAIKVLVESVPEGHNRLLEDNRFPFGRYLKWTITEK